MQLAETLNLDSCAERPSVLARKTSSPKRAYGGGLGRSNWFPYYAGFSRAFVDDILDSLASPNNPTILDPWVGCGTTAEAAAARGLPFFGFDINPVVLIVATARTISSSSATAILVAGTAVGMSLNRMVIKNSIPPMDSANPLGGWLEPSCAAAISAFELAIKDLDLHCLNAQAVKDDGAVRAILYVALFRTLRVIISSARRSNPTWLADTLVEKADWAPDKLFLRFAEELERIAFTLFAEDEGADIQPADCLIEQASSTCLPLRPKSIDIVLTSPPYCTRLDYVRATLPELALLGEGSGAQRRVLSRSMIGTTAMTNSGDRIADWGITCSAFLDAVECHPSKASRTYYHKYFCQYFKGVFTSLIEIDRVLKPGGRAVLVVQDSYYKELHIDLPAIFSELGAKLKWVLESLSSYNVRPTLAASNPNARRYRSDFSAKEAVLVFMKETAARSNA